MPVYNAELYVAQAIRSILSQTFQDFELIIVDDGSTDRSLEILKTFNDPRIRLISRPNTGIVGALNDGIALVRAAIVARMDADDVACRDRLKHQFEYLEAHSDVVALGTSVLLIDPEGMPIMEQAAPIGKEKIEEVLLCGDGRGIVHPSLMMKTSTLIELGGYRQRFNFVEDLDLFLRLGERGNLANLPHVLLFYRQHFGSTNYSRCQEQCKLAREVVIEAAERRGLNRAPGMIQSELLPKTPAQIKRMWSYHSASAGNFHTARKYLSNVISSDPYSLRTWRFALKVCLMSFTTVRSKQDSW